jgi:hypothetical protein
MSKFAVQDRFHIGGIVWHDAIPQAQLDIIEGRLRALGSMTIVMYASDQAWYEKRIKEDTRGNMLSFESMVGANNLYCHMVTRIDELVTEPIVDYGFDVRSCKGYLGDDARYPDAEYANRIIDKWFERLTLLEKL